MEKERVNIKMQRHLRPLTTSSKASAMRGGTRPNTAGAALTGGNLSKPRSSRVSKQSLRESHMQAFGKSREFVGPDVTDGIHPVTSSLKGCQHGPQAFVDPGGLIPEPDEVCLHLEEIPESEPRYPTLDTWLTGIEHSSDEFDTDVEDSFDTTPMTSISVDATGRMEYEEQCKKLGFVPVSYLCRNLGERNIRMRHRYLGGTATKPLALAFKVRHTLHYC
ncbi:hypothetical protein EGW08_017497 [Elysia chlorotica]|uniref:Uncharacterized protein n=1 Tax=Elysia chlorotica TaxID=188477 RepID=A0A433SZL8_ELYCH|nr:hypothetical protein EGW08_017497 [Elysia chlorotica]